MNSLSPKYVVPRAFPHTLWTSSRMKFPAAAAAFRNSRREVIRYLQCSRASSPRVFSSGCPFEAHRRSFGANCTNKGKNLFRLSCTCRTAQRGSSQRTLTYVKDNTPRQRATDDRGTPGSELLTTSLQRELNKFFDDRPGECSALSPGTYTKQRARHLRIGHVVVSNSRHDQEQSGSVLPEQHESFHLHKWTRLQPVEVQPARKS
jgi:hypothetical protein